MITKGEAAIPLETTRRAFGNQEKSKQRSTIESIFLHTSSAVNMINPQLTNALYLGICIIKFVSTIETVVIVRYFSTNCANSHVIVSTVKS